MKLEDFLESKKIQSNQDIKYPFKKVKTTQDYVLLFFEDEKIMISLEDYFKYDIKNISGLSEELYDQFKDRERLLKAYRGCLRKLSLRDHSIKQIRDYLLKNELKNNETDDIIDRLCEYGLLDDEKYCIGKINYYNNSLYSAKQIRLKLLKDGIDEELINRYLDNKNEYEKITKLVEKYSKVKGKSVNALRQSIMIKLTGNGYSYEKVRNVLDSFNLNNENELELLRKEYQKAFRKYSRKYDNYDLRNHVFTYLMSKGFQSDDIKEVLEENNG